MASLATGQTTLKQRTCAQLPSRSHNSAACRNLGSTEELPPCCCMAPAATSRGSNRSMRGALTNARSAHLRNSNWHTFEWEERGRGVCSLTWCPPCAALPPSTPAAAARRHISTNARPCAPGCTPLRRTPLMGDGEAVMGHIFIPIKHNIHIQGAGAVARTRHHVTPCE